MKKQWLLVIAVIAFLAVFAAKKYFGEKKSDTKITATELKSSTYWTCPMHPQIHMDHAGECPICHMKLIQVKAQENKMQESNRADVQVSSSDLTLIGVQKEQVESMDLNLSIPVSGRLLSSTSVAFQVYENDLRFVKPGLSFKGHIADGEIAGSVTSVDSIVDPTSRTVRVIGRIEKGPNNLVAETTFAGSVDVKLKNRVSISESSVLHTGTGDLVYVFSEGNKLTPRKIMLGAKTEGFYEVTSGLQPGEFISSGPNFLIDSEAKIRGTSEGEGKTNLKKPSCPEGEHWDTPMAMCMPGKG
jgi:Cu(I)/Ag(I) efflux system membrane fusion protein